jgi:hypothetical protein
MRTTYNLAGAKRVVKIVRGLKATGENRTPRHPTPAQHYFVGPTTFALSVGRVGIRPTRLRFQPSNSSDLKETDDIQSFRECG